MIPLARLRLPRSGGVWSPTARPERRSPGPAVNRVPLVGRLTADPEARIPAGGLAVTTIRLVTNDRGEPEYLNLCRPDFSGRGNTTKYA